MRRSRRLFARARNLFERRSCASSFIKLTATQARHDASGQNPGHRAFRLPAPIGGDPDHANNQRRFH
jgi:hypothetical protein